MNKTVPPYTLLTGENPVFTAYVTWIFILAVKMMLMSILTGIFRFKNAAVANPEDAMKPTMEVKTDEEVERVRRAHLNDLENILPLLTIGLIYVLTDPSPMVAVNLFRIAGIIRIIHTVVYAIYPLRQPTRAICFFTCFAITIYMAIVSIIRFW
ncbi:microsomal glutathione S-transferase 1-like [Phlebotomus papatasi]|uniref:microsomal glutathione S-transferase 1-like n=1 Tax=Phlebotomus papatasi TaxID=29031 RepID=UPI0024842DFD|nr:microsomal glutathione S-transferase 1-like [Phlebotomus papatasi]